jgi:hypothetical protein
MNFLKENLQKDLGLSAEAIKTLDGSMSDVELNEVIEKFGDRQSSLRLIIATDVASEGINLHFLCYRLIHFDIPWSLMALQQRNGRIDRYGQEHTPLIRYMLTRSQNKRMDEAERIIRVLIKKDEQATKNIGDPSVFMGVFEVDEEVRITATAIERGESAADFEARLNEVSQDPEFDFFALLDGEVEVSDEREIVSQIQKFPYLWEDDFHYTLKSLEMINQNNILQYNVRAEEYLIELTMPRELERRYDRLPREIQPGSKQPLKLCADRQLVQKDLEESRKAEEKWVPIQYLWELHPVVQWLNDLNLTIFGRHQAPVLNLPTLANEEVVFVMTGLIPNRRGQPLLHEWFSVVFQGEKFARIENFADTVERTALNKRDIPNRKLPVPPQLSDLRDEAVSIARQEMMQKRQVFEKRINQELQEQLNRLESLKKEHYVQLELRFQDNSPLVTEKKQREKDNTEAIFTEYFRWVEDSMTTEPQPYIKIIAVLQGI